VHALLRCINLNDIFLQRLARAPVGFTLAFPLRSGWVSFPASSVLSLQDAKGAVVSYIRGSVRILEGVCFRLWRGRWRECIIFFYSPLKGRISSCKCH